MSSGNVNLLVPDDERGRTESLIAAICNDIRDLLLAKNRAYGNSALKPIRIFSKADAREQLLVRIDDKLYRIKQGNDSLESDEDVITDLIGYLVLLKVGNMEMEDLDLDYDELMEGYSEELELNKAILIR